MRIIAVALATQSTILADAEIMLASRGYGGALTTPRPHDRPRPSRPPPPLMTPPTTRRSESVYDGWDIGE
jgi:hypothetical protein